MAFLKNNPSPTCHVFQFCCEARTSKSMSIPVLQLNSNLVYDSEGDVFSDSSRPGTPKVHNQQSFFQKPHSNSRRHSQLQIFGNAAASSKPKLRPNSSASSVGSSKSNKSEESYVLSQEVLQRIENIEKQYEESKKLW